MSTRITSILNSNFYKILHGIQLLENNTPKLFNPLIKNNIKTTGPP